MCVCVSYLMQHIESDRVEEVLHNHPKDGTRAARVCTIHPHPCHGNASSLDSVDGLQGGLGSLGGREGEE